MRAIKKKREHHITKQDREDAMYTGGVDPSFTVVQRMFWPCCRKLNIGTPCHAVCHVEASLLCGILQKDFLIQGRNGGGEWKCSQEVIGSDIEDFKSKGSTMCVGGSRLNTVGANFSYID